MKDEDLAASTDRATKILAQEQGVVVARVQVADTQRGEAKLARVDVTGESRVSDEFLIVDAVEDLSDHAQRLE